MALLWMDGFDNYGTDIPVSRSYVVSGTWATQQTGRFSDSKSVSSGAASLLRWGLPAAKSTLASGVSFKTDSALTNYSTTGPGFSLGESGQVRFGVYVNSLGALVGCMSSNNNTNVRCTSASSLIAVNTWYHIGFEIVRHASAGAIYIYLDGVLVASATGVNTYSADFDFIQLNTAPGGSTTTVFDDWYINDVATWSGEARISPLVPTSDTAQLDFTPSTGTDHYALVDDLPANTTDYVSSGTVGHKDRYGMTNMPFTPLNIIAVKTNIIAKKDEIATRTFRSNLKSGSTTANGATHAAGSSFSLAGDIYELDPATSAAWTKSAVDALELGVELVA